MSARVSAACAVAFSCLLVSSCSQSLGVDDVMTAGIGGSSSSKERDCLARAMFFESHRSSRDGLVAVGSVVMNRVESGEYPDTICGVVGQKNQFAPGVLTRNMKSKALPDVMAAADSVLAGERHPKVGRAKFFHQAGLTFPYKNMHYVLEAGGNAFYERRSRAEMRAAAEIRKIAEAKSAGEIPVMSFAVDPAKADAIGALIAGKDRAEED